MTRIAFIDDQQGALDPLRAMLADEGHDIERHRDGDFAMTVFQRRMPDLVVLNLGSAKSGGLGVMERIRARWTVPVVVMSAAKDEIDEILALRLGADDFLRKTGSARLAVARITAILRRISETVAGPKSMSSAEQVISHGDLIMDPGRHEVIWKEQEVSLTVTEFDLLMSLVRRPGVVKNRDRLMSEVYSENIFVDDRTIDSHIKRIRRKIRTIDPEFDGIETIYGVGYRFCAPRKTTFQLKSIGVDRDERLAA
jgi:two-component system response regulator ChvI